MKKVEKEIISLLKQNARVSVDDIAKFVGIEKSEAEAVIGSLEKQGVIVNYTVVINEKKMEKIDIKARALVEVCINPEKNKGFNEIAKKICRFKEVIDHYLIAGRYDFLLIVEGDTIEEISAFVYDKLATLENVRSTGTHFFMKKYKEKGIMLEEENISERLVISP
jgi:DNA-binding Lrp family transcriptional regulator